ncbi:hypothetical protein M0R19_00955 [Candidatus Pacearchaeota archaeon]|jgi:hypothetical protein|nr:hypothetical protein [Candidatus Pacearchaeota archaeon]
MKERDVPREVGRLKNPYQMKRFYNKQIKEYTSKPYDLDKEHAEGKAKEDILFTALNYDQETFNRWAKIIKESKKN